jgi:hypothetical protein
MAEKKKPSESEPLTVVDEPGLAERFQRGLAVAVFLLATGTAFAQSASPNCSNTVEGNNSGSLTNNCPTFNLGPPRQSNELYQSGQRIGLTGGIDYNKETQKIVLTNTRIDGMGINLTSPFELQGARILCPDLAQSAQNAVHITIVINGSMTCDVIGPR